jgi:hypothetical protein
MTATLSPQLPAARRSIHRRRHTVTEPRRTDVHGHPTVGSERLLARYRDWQGDPREVLARQGAGGSVLVVDRDAATCGDRQLVAHLGADEPAENAALVCGAFVRDARGGPCRCRGVTEQDTATVPFADQEDQAREQPAGARSRHAPQPADALGRSYRLELLHTGMSIPELRWRRHPPEHAAGWPRVVSLREAVGCLESYEPLRPLTVRELAIFCGERDVSTSVLRSELARVQNSPIVLNRRLREVVLGTLERERLSMSEIAIRCGRVKRDRKGNESGETSWLARRLGLLPEAGRSTPTPWIHSDVLALIAREGLGIGPREVELG